MYNLKVILKEELKLNSLKNILTEQSLTLINNEAYVKHVLGLEIPLNEHFLFEHRKKIIQEQINLQSVLNSANKFLGSAITKGKETAITVVDNIQNMKDVALLFKDLIISPEYMQKAITILSQTCKALAEKIKIGLATITQKIGVNIQNFSDRFKNIMDHIVDTLINQSKLTGWVGFLSMLGFSTLITYIDEQIFKKFINKGVSFISENPDFISGLTTILNLFKDFKTTIIGSLDVSQILSWFVKISKSAAFETLVISIDIILTMGIVLKPIIKSIDWSKKLIKK